MITLETTLLDINDNEVTNCICDIKQVIYTRLIVGNYDPNDPKSELDQMKEKLAFRATVFIRFFDSLDHSILNKMDKAKSYKFPDIAFKFQCDVDIYKMNEKDVSIYFDELARDYLIKQGIDSNVIKLS